jgi:hypothetical protein
MTWRGDCVARSARSTQQPNTKHLRLDPRRSEQARPKLAHRAAQQSYWKGRMGHYHSELPGANIAPSSKDGANDNDDRVRLRGGKQGALSMARKESARYRSASPALGPTPPGGAFLCGANETPPPGRRLSRHDQVRSISPGAISTPIETMSTEGRARRKSAQENTPCSF